MDYSKMPYDYLKTKYSNLVSEEITIKAQIKFREEYIAKRIIKERLVNPGYDFDGTNFTNDKYEFVFSRESGYETYNDYFYVPLEVMNDPVNKLDEYLKPYIEKRDLKEQKEKFAEIKKEFNKQKQKLQEIKNQHPHINFDE